MLVSRARLAGSDIGYVTGGAFACGTPVAASHVDRVDQTIVSTPLERISESFRSIQAHDEYDARRPLALMATKVF